ncbi:MAG TPA: TIGR03790 family protein, partial [Terriglobales bacterium]|nr:TIGR03790 family protein [Terriglobales bacterium]
QACLDRQYGAIGGIYDFSYGSGDWDLHQAANFASQAGFGVTEDQNVQEFGTSPAPLCPGAALYSGWYHLNHYNDAFTWNTGAIGFHLDSLSAADPRMGSNWAANAIKKGITVTSGAMAEPYLDGLAHPDGVFLNLLEGANVGDAFLRNEMWLKWMILNIGDPLYTPFAGGKPPFNGPDPQNALVLTPQDPVGPQSATGTVVLANPAPPGGTLVNLKSSNSSIASVPPSVTVPQGQTSATFTITTATVINNQKVFITASGGINEVNTLGVVPLLGGIAANVPNIIGGGTITAAVVLDENAPQNGTVVNLSSSNPSIAPVPATVTVPAGADKVLFTIPTSAVASRTNVTFSATLLGAKYVASVIVTPVLSSLNLGKTSVTGGTSDGGNVQLLGQAYAGGVTVNLSSNNSSVASVPATVTVPQGATVANFTVTTTAVSTATQVVLTASSGDSVKQVTLTVNPPAVRSLTLTPSQLVGGQKSTGTVTLNGIAPSGGAPVGLSSSNPSIAQVAPSVTVPAGHTSATFTVTTSPVQTQTAVTITATYNGTQTKTLTVNP